VNELNQRASKTLPYGAKSTWARINSIFSKIIIFGMRPTIVIEIAIFYFSFPILELAYLIVIEIANS
jgi:hypothetical protein